jgi:putative glutamine amidotransferase
MKKIGIVAWDSNGHIGISIPYAKFVEKWGEVVILTPRKGIVENLDLLILPGGPDISSHLYGEVPNYYNSNACKLREYFYVNNLPQYVEANVPIFGICLGMQQLNVFFGGSLIQDVSHKMSNPRSEDHEKLTVTDELVNAVNIVNWKEVITKKTYTGIKVNSLHHQCVSRGTISDQFDICATSEINGNVEAFIHKTLPIAGVQYHPEELGYDIITNTLIKTILTRK